MNQRTRRHVETGFRSVRDALIFGAGGWGFWFLITRTRHPDPWLVGACIGMMAFPTGASLYRIVNAIYGTSGRLLRELDREREGEP